MRQKQKGISIVEVIITIVILALLGAVGWRIYQARQADKKAEEARNAQQQTQTPADKAHFAYTNYDFGYQFKYPGAWNVSEAKSLENPDGPVQYSSTFESPDFKTGEGGAGFTISEGARMYVSVEPISVATPAEYLATNNFLQTAAKNKQDMTLDGQQALSFEVDENNMHNLTALAVKDGRLYGFIFEYANAAAHDKYKAEYELLISSFKFDYDRSDE